MYCKLRRLDLLRNGMMSDCELHVVYTDRCKKLCCRQFRCHKVMLASASEEFERVINESDFENNNRVITVDDASPDAYEALLLYIYTYEIYNAITMEMCGELIHLATKYKMPDFVDGYISKLADQDWSMSTVLKIFQLANEHNRPAVMRLVREKIEPVAKQVLNDNTFIRFNVKELKALMIILKDMNVVPEQELLKALKKYQRCNRLSYENMSCFKQFVDVAQLFGDVHFAADGTLALENTIPIPTQNREQSQITAFSELEENPTEQEDDTPEGSPKN